jgi:hypothetical protein
MPSPLNDKELEAVLAHHWTIDCLRMTLRQQGTNALKYSGPGSVRHGSESGLEYVLYDTIASSLEFRSFGGNAGDQNASDFTIPLVSGSGNHLDSSARLDTIAAFRRETVTSS